LYWVGKLERQLFLKYINNKKTHTMTQVKIKTKSNYRNLNGTTQDVYEVVGTRVTCLIFVDEFQKSIQVDFNINEVTFI
jgi:hypothetical protein